MQTSPTAPSRSASSPRPGRRPEDAARIGWVPTMLRWGVTLLAAAAVNDVFSPHGGVRELRRPPVPARPDALAASYGLPLPHTRTLRQAADSLDLSHSALAQSGDITVGTPNPDAMGNPADTRAGHRYAGEPGNPTG